MSIRIASSYIREYEYMGKMPGFSSHAFGHFFGEICGGVLVFGSPTGRHTAMFPGRKMLQLKRGVSLPGTPHCSSSFLISRALRLLQKNTDFDVVVAFANPHDAEIGTVYQASNWAYTGLTNGEPTFLVEGDRIHSTAMQGRHGTRSIAVLQKIYGDRLVVTPGVRKHRYAYALRKDLIIPSQPYPKRERAA